MNARVPEGHEPAAVPMPPSPMADVGPPRVVGDAALPWVAAVSVVLAVVAATIAASPLYIALRASTPFTLFGDAVRAVFVVLAVALADRKLPWSRMRRWGLAMAVGGLVCDDSLSDFASQGLYLATAGAYAVGVVLSGVACGIGGVLLAWAASNGKDVVWRMALAGMAAETIWLAIVTALQALVNVPLPYPIGGGQTFYPLTPLSWLSGCMNGAVFGAVLGVHLARARRREEEGMMRDGG